MIGLAALLLWGCRPPEGAAGGDLRRGEVLLAHTNDLHAHYRPGPAPWLEGAPELGGFMALDAHLRAIRAGSGGELVYLDGGDLLSGTPLVEVPSRGVEGGVMLDFLAAAGCNGWVVGNHELDRGLEHARRFVAASPVPALVANLDAADGSGPLLPGSRPHVLVAHNGLTIGVFGLITDGMEQLTSRETSGQLVTRDLAVVAREQVALLEPRVDLVVALTHAGLHADRALAREVEGIDLIVGGHTHSAVEPPEKVEDTWIVQAGSYGRQLGLVRLSVEDGVVTELRGELIDLHPDRLPGPPGPEVEAILERLQVELAAYEEVVGRLPAPLARAEQGQSPLGRWAAELVRAAAGADVGAVNAGGLRADLASGEVRRGDLYQVFPFENEVQSFPISGEALLGILLQAATRELEGRVPLQLSGAVLEWRVRLGAPEVVAATVGGQPLRLDRTYRLATSSFLADQAEERFGLPAGAAGEVTGHGVTVLEAAVAAVRRGEVGPPAGAGATVRR